VRDGVEGRVLAPRDPDAWAAAVRELLADPDGRKRMGEAGRTRARAVSDPGAHAAAIEAVYRRIAS
jgi:glycosyltransferase involved in cell wall biosynthesis